VASLVEQPPALSWYKRLWLKVLRRPIPVGTLGVTSFAGGVAVWYEGTSPQAGRLIDLYGRTGYVATWLLPERPLGIAASKGRIYALAIRNDSAFLSSYILPSGLRNALLDSIPPMFAPRAPSDADVIRDPIIR
jgi:hypothetical protein